MTKTNILIFSISIYYDTMAKTRAAKTTFRATARVVIYKGNKILSMEGVSSRKNDRFFVLPGGTIEFGEDSKTTLIREIKEELGAKLRDIRYMGVIENIFLWRGKKHHEFVFIYSAKFTEGSMYYKSSIEGQEDTGHKFRC